MAVRICVFLFTIYLLFVHLIDTRQCSFFSRFAFVKYVPHSKQLQMHSLRRLIFYVVWLFFVLLLSSSNAKNVMPSVTQWACSLRLVKIIGLKYVFSSVYNDLATGFNTVAFYCVRVFVWYLFSCNIRNGVSVFLVSVVCCYSQWCICAGSMTVHSVSKSGNNFPTPELQMIIGSRL